MRTGHIDPRVKRGYGGSILTKLGWLKATRAALVRSTPVALRCLAFDF